MDLLFSITNYVSQIVKTAFVQKGIMLSTSNPYTLEKHQRRKQITNLYVDTRKNIKDNFEIVDVEISEYQEENQWIHTIIYGKGQGKPKILLVHGFAGTSLSFCKMVKPLSEKYEVYVIDLPGMGLSSKPLWKMGTSEEVIGYFTQSIEEWRKKLSIGTFTIVGHSLGGYISGNYALKYPQNLDKVILLSPVGTTKQTQENIQQYMQQSSLIRKIWHQFFQFLWFNQFTFNRLYTYSNLPTQKLLEKYVDIFLTPENKDIKWSWVDYMDKMLQHPESGEKCVFQMLQFPKFDALLPLEETFASQNIKVPVHFCFGGQKEDWMAREGAQFLINQQIINGTFTEMPGFDHHFPFFKPHETTKYILEK